MVDIFEYLNSKDVKGYLKKLDYKFNILEASWIIYQSHDLNLNEKIKAWKEIMGKMPDMPFEKSNLDKKYGSVHKLINDYIKLQEETTRLLTEDNEDALYKITVYDVSCSPMYEHCYPIFDSFEKVKEFIKDKYIDDAYAKNHMYYKCNDHKILVLKFIVDKIRKNGESGYGRILIDGNGNIKETFREKNYLSEYEYDLQNRFFDIYFDFPIPFKKGDILVDPYMPRECCILDPFSFKETSQEVYRKKGSEGNSTLDMTAYGYFVNRYIPSIYYECMHNYMNLEYFNEKIDGINRLLLPVSNLMKEEIGIDVAMLGYYQILLEEQVKINMSSFTLINKEGKKLAGVDQE